MARPKKNIVKLTDNEVKQLKGMLQKNRYMPDTYQPLPGSFGFG